MPILAEIWTDEAFETFQESVEAPAEATTEGEALKEDMEGDATADLNVRIYAYAV